MPGSSARCEYERLSHRVRLEEGRLQEHLFGPRPFADVLLAEEAGAVIGFALFFHNYSTFVGEPGLYLEDLFVEPEHRGRGHGKALLRAVARLVVTRGCGRLEWSVLNWNESAIRFYRSLGAVPMNEWTVYRLMGDALTAAASRDGGRTPRLLAGRGIDRFSSPLRGGEESLSESSEKRSVMPHESQKPYRVVDFTQIPGVPCPCGTARRAFADVESFPGTVHVTEIAADARRHYHRCLTETYFILECRDGAMMELDAEQVPVRPGMCVLIPPGVRHRAVGPTKVLLVVLPKFDPDDEWFD
ncbi:MAG TPA: GNAT family N-acetyltransferase [Gemmataceae bacterium]|nr:GNAT family N-acetyltransferase [Gemmataceae bacterium]